MTLEDPFYVVKDEVFKALNKTRGLYLRWQEVSRQSGACAGAGASPARGQGQGQAGGAAGEREWTCTELRNALRSIQWDLEDLEDTICIVEKNSSKFKIDNKEISDRRSFIEATKQEVKMMKGAMSMRRDSDETVQEPLLGRTSPVHGGGGGGGGGGAVWGGAGAGAGARYSRLACEPEPEPAGRAHEREHDHEHEHEARLHALGTSVGSLRTLSKQIGVELDEQAVMLDDLNTELENADSKLDSTIKKVAKVLHMNNDRRQWLAITILIALLVVILILFIII